ncbi:MULTISPECIES: polysaccharide biosynthesis tyrosine autokinase [unclassified Mesorhizobium]|uniref:GumC family protein n=1 Tax=unclassified Mesorhizobium TaxID=325217 RepID=UPI000FD1C3F2|nr:MULTISPECIES: polysaccharide biosynthesis tyrosine autokinase [unclassified Mesorhizobium]RUX04996.1 polysaccharide biosynthesis tyrosine autokinase [Mesorhizobium sp. M8A.F.Ca.ET.023.01.1.1]TGV08474.1 polysaccharide biosynthesis tyrosine autokinase [Mesorhizobium sp. M8A.F.Ca.ET.173.01.1.1]RWC68500.1 MAG: polysaccharide biosynthesis tyrosine autokinase [Mesorhizobium sp.]RWC69058.1 MAG: polysaccharide biosynthesis tyrosine autokinase [Mesorhizobium sp.]RWF50976.1 MAG: polysaccharide biosyn
MASSIDSPTMTRELLPLDVREILDFFLRRWKLVCSIAALTFAAFVAAAYLLPPSYTGVAQVLLDAPIDYMTPQDYSNSDFADNSTFIESQIAVLRSTSLLQKVVDSEKLTEDPKIGPGALIWLQGALGVSRVGLADVIEISVTAYDPGKAASLANAISQAYLADRVRSRYEGAKKASTWLSERATSLRAELSLSEQAVQKFRIDHNLLATPAGSLTDQQLSELNVALITARAELSEKRAQYQQVDKLLTSGGDIQSMPDVLQSVVISALRAQIAGVTRREADLKLKYGDRHPDVLAAQAERRDIEGQITAEVQRLIGNLKNEVDAAEAREASLSRALNSVSNRSEVEGQVGVQLRDLERIAAANKELFETFLSRAKLTEEKSTLLNSGVRVITDAVVPGSPSFPNRPLFAALGLVLGFFVGGAGAVLRELFASGFMAKKQIEEELSVPVLASIPRMAGWSRDAHSQAQPVAYLERRPLSRFSEAVRRLRLGIDATPEQARLPRLMLVTSAMPGEGKTTLVLSLACSAAADGERVLVVDADLRLSATTAFFGMVDKVGLVDLLTLPVKAANAIHRDERSGISLLPAGARTRNPPALLASARMRSVFEELRGKFDTVIIDAPPVGAAADATILARYVDKVLFVVKWRETSREAVAEGIRHLGGRSKIAGIALTMVDEPKLPKYGRYTSIESSVSDSYYLN